MKTDVLKAALAKKNSTNQDRGMQSQTGTKDAGPRSQISTNKPARKSSGRGR